MFIILIWLMKEQIMLTLSIITAVCFEMKHPVHLYSSDILSATAA